MGWGDGHVSELCLVGYAVERRESHNRGWSHRIEFGDQD
jgi:hypothetical protein